MKIRIEWDFDDEKNMIEPAKGSVEVHGDDATDLWLAAVQSAMAGAGYHLSIPAALQFVEDKSPELPGAPAFGVD